jgi:hypothetical protein
MSRRTPRLDAFECEQIARSSRALAVQCRIFQDLDEEAVRLGVLPPANRLEGIEVDVRVARIVNSRTPPRADR